MRKHVALALVALACKREPVAEAEPASSATIRSVDLPRAGATTRVPFDEERDVALVVAGNPEVHRPIVYLQGAGTDPKVDLEAFAGLAASQGTVLAMTDPSDDDVVRTDGRITLAIAAINGAGVAPPLVDGDLVVIGSGSGATRAEALAAMIPSRYARLVLVGGPPIPSASALSSVKAIATVAGDREPQAAMRRAAHDLARAGVPSRFFVLPGAAHGDFGPDGHRILGAAVAFVTSR